MINNEKILKLANDKGAIATRDFIVEAGVTRQYISGLISELVKEGKLVKIGSTRGAIYVTPEYLELHPDVLPRRYHKVYKNIDLEEHKILSDVEMFFYGYNDLSDNIKSIFAYGFSEMLNNAIEHSQSKKIEISVYQLESKLYFVVEDFGIGVFRNIMNKRSLNNELEAIQDLLKGKITTAPKLHSGEGIFFTSKVADEFILESYGDVLLIDNRVDDVFVKKNLGKKQGTKVTFEIDINQQRHLNDIFKQYTHPDGDDNFGFDKTEVRIKLYTRGGVHISRSQARRVLSGLEKFNVIVFDYEEVPMVGQAFADEIYRVFHNTQPKIKIINENMNEAVEFMVRRAQAEAGK